jgi:hypothetical protein
MSMWLIPIYALTQLSASGLPMDGTGNGDQEIQTILSIAFGAIGALALLMIVLSGMRYITSAGDPEKMKKAKDSIIYALVGLTVAIVAESIVGLVVGRI